VPLNLDASAVGQYAGLLDGNAAADAYNNTPGGTSRVTDSFIYNFEIAPRSELIISGFLTAQASISGRPTNTNDFFGQSASIIIIGGTVYRADASASYPYWDPAYQGTGLSTVSAPVYFSATFLNPGHDYLATGFSSTIDAYVQNNAIAMVPEVSTWASLILGLAFAVPYGAWRRSKNGQGYRLI